MPSSRVSLFHLSAHFAASTLSSSSADFQNAKLFSTDALDPAKPDVAGPATNIPDSKGASVQQITPNPVEPSNILLQQFPAPVTDSVKPIIATIEYYAYAIMAGLGGLWFFTAFGSGWMAFLFRSSLFGGLAFCVYVAHGIIGRKVEKEIERIRLDQIKQRGEEVSSATLRAKKLGADLPSLAALSPDARVGRVAQLVRQGCLASHQPFHVRLHRRHDRGRDAGVAAWFY